MARRAKVTTRTGDTGYTGLIGRERVPKWDPRPDTFGTLDEATSALGIARAVSNSDEVKALILTLQREIYQVMAELALSPEAYEDSQFKITEQHVVDLEARTDELKQDTEIGNVFIIPGETLPGAAIDLARTVVRRGERLAAHLYHDGMITNAEILRYLNRLSDLLFVLARYEEQHAGVHAQEARTARTRKQQRAAGDVTQD
jgi:cob(I)alamin adenosyltransferase